MRPDFNRLLVERERIHSRDHFHNYRNVKGPKGLDDDEVGGRQPMRIRYNHGYDRKHFNENLNPLKGWLRSCIGKNWNKCYSDLRKTFDCRGVINAHILQHLFDYIEVNTFVDAHGQVMARSKGWSRSGDMPVSECGSDFYVCPKSGMVRSTNKKSYRTIRKQREKEAAREKLNVERWLDSDNVLRFIDGAWYHFEVRNVPEVKVSYVKPWNKDNFECGSWGKKVVKRWEEMNEHERRDHGTKQFDGQVRDVFTNELMGRYQETARYGSRVSATPNIVHHGKLRYHATKKTASHKQLKEAGLAV